MIDRESVALALLPSEDGAPDAVLAPRTEVVNTVLVRPHVDDVLNDGVRLLKAQMHEYASLGRGLEPQEIRALTQMMEALTKLTRLDLERRKAEEAGGWSVEELWAFVTEAERQGHRPGGGA